MDYGGDCRFDCISTAKTLKIRGMNIGHGMQERLKTGRVSDERMYKFEKQWTEKLRKLDEKHTNKNNLTDLEAAKILCRIGKFFEVETPSICPESKHKIILCMDEHKKPEICTNEVDEFTNCVDDMLIKTIRKCSPDYVETRRPTYREKFDRAIKLLHLQLNF